MSERYFNMGRGDGERSARRALPPPGGGAQHWEQREYHFGQSGGKSRVSRRRRCSRSAARLPAGWRYTAEALELHGRGEGHYLSQEFGLVSEPSGERVARSQWR